MTAVEWLAEKYNEVNWLRNRDEISSKYADELREGFLNQAKEMEKQQRSYSEEEVEDIMAETWIQCVGNDGNNFKEVRNKILEQFKKK